MNPIDYSKLRSLTVRQLIRALRQDGFVFERQTGSHQQYRHPDGRQVTVSFHQSRLHYVQRGQQAFVVGKSITEYQKCGAEAY